MLASYPFHAPPGTLAEELLLTPGGRTHPPLLIPADPLDLPAHSPWTGVRHRTVGELRKYPGAPDVRAADRPFERPHAELLRRDLDAVPAVYLQLGMAGYDLVVRLGGSALLPGEILSVLPAVTLQRVGYREPEEWTAAELAALGAPRNQDDLVPRLGQPRSDGSADRSRSDDEVAHAGAGDFPIFVSDVIHDGSLGVDDGRCST